MSFINLVFYTKKGTMGFHAPSADVHVFVVFSFIDLVPVFR